MDFAPPLSEGVPELVYLPAYGSPGMGCYMLRRPHARLRAHVAAGGSISAWLKHHQKTGPPATREQQQEAHYRSEAVRELTAYLKDEPYEYRPFVPPDPKDPRGRPPHQIYR